MGECALLPGNFGILVQLVLAVVCVATLIFKKSRESHGRTWFVFLLDSSKQLVGFGFAHILNMMSAVALANVMVGDACDWYWLNIMIDTTLGVFLEYLLLRCFTSLLERQLGEFASEYRSGEYYDTAGHELYKIYAKQLGLWLCCILGMKIIVILILFLFGSPLFSIASTILWLVSWSSQLKLITVMILTPGIMNALQVWLTDNFIQKGGTSYSQLGHGCLGCCIEGLLCLDGYITGEKERGRREYGLRADHARPFLEQSFDEERAQWKLRLAEYTEANERLAEENEQLVLAESRLLPDKERAEAEAKVWEERMRDALEKAYKAEQEKRLIIEEQKLLRERMQVKEDREKQLLLRIQQLEFSYKAAGNAANAVFAAEVSAATVAAQGRLNRHLPSETEALALTDIKRGGVIDDFCNSLQPLPPPAHPPHGPTQITALPSATMLGSKPMSSDFDPGASGLAVQSWQSTPRPLSSRQHVDTTAQSRYPYSSDSRNPFGSDAIFTASRRPLE